MSCRTSAILLAAGSSRRMGRLKQLLPFNGKSMIECCLDSLERSGIDDIVAVLGDESDRIEELVNGRQVGILYNGKTGSDMAESVRIGLRGISLSSTAVVVALADHPLVAPETIGALVKIHMENPGCILIPVYKEQRGHPTLFPRGIAEEIFKCGTLRDIIGKEPGRILCIDSPDEGIIRDIDTMDDYLSAVDIQK